MLWTTGEAARAIGVNERTVQNWISSGIIPTVREGQGSGNHHMLNDVAVLAIALARHSRSRGLSLKQAGGVCEWLLGQELNALKKLWGKGKRYLMVVGDEVSPFLSTREMIFGVDSEIDLFGAHIAGVPVAVLDVKDSHDRIENWRVEQGKLAQVGDKR